MQRKSKYLWAALAASLCLIMALLVMLGMSLRRQPLTGTYLCEGLSPGAGTYLVFDGKGDYTLYRQSGVLSAGTYAEDANGVYVLKGEGLTVPVCDLRREGQRAFLLRAGHLHLSAHQRYPHVYQRGKAVK